jgi:NitT/TauT family transport system permease protein
MFSAEPQRALAPDLAGVAPNSPAGIWWDGIAAGCAWLGAALLTAGWPNADQWDRTREFSMIEGVLGALVFFLALIPRGPADRIRRLGPWLVVLGIIFAAWEIVTAKLALLPPPFFAPPQALLDVYLSDWPRLGESALRSLLLLLSGYAIGAVLGFVTGIALGWSRIFGYWAHPLLRFIGPLPATAWLPLAFFIFPTSGSASTFLVALATGFPVAVLTWSGVASVNSAYYDIARTLGAKQRFLVLRIAIPGALPHVFVGLFMGLGASFSVLVVAEMLGVKAGLGWYLQWAQGWASYPNMYAALLVMALLFSGLITLLFRTRDRFLAWQRGLVRW